MTLRAEHCDTGYFHAMTRFEQRAQGYVERINGTLDACLPAPNAAPASLHAAMRYAILGGGKRIRPLLCYATGEALHVDAQLLDAPACAVELVHGFSLVHDDLPAMDDDALRRGKPTAHKAFGEATAILAGDALQTLAFRVLATSLCTPAQRITMLRILADATGSLGMTGGQVMDMEAEGQDIDLTQLEELNHRKTGCLIHASVMMACAAVSDLAAEHHRALDDFSRNIGLAFQIRDDLLDVEGDAALTGKASGADAAHHKSTWPSLLGVDAARQRAEDASARALRALEPLHEAADPLRWMAQQIVQRDN